MRTWISCGLKPADWYEFWEQSPWHHACVWEQSLLYFTMRTSWRTSGWIYVETSEKSPNCSFSYSCCVCCTLGSAQMAVVFRIAHILMKALYLDRGWNIASPREAKKTETFLSNNGAITNSVSAAPTLKKNNTFILM